MAAVVKVMGVTVWVIVVAGAVVKVMGVTVWVIVVAGAVVVTVRGVKV